MNDLIRRGMKSEVLSFDYVEFAVANAKQAAFFYQKAFGFQCIAYRGPETGLKDYVSYVLKQGEIIFLLTSSLRPDTQLNQRVSLHGDGIRSLALQVSDVEAAFSHAVKNGAISIEEPKIISDDYGSISIASIQTYGDTIHTFIDRSDYRSELMPGFIHLKNTTSQDFNAGLVKIDHCVANVPRGEMDQWVDFYRSILNFRVLLSFDDRDISTEYSALKSKVVANQSASVKLPINESAPGKHQSQIDEFIDYYQGSGVQHIAMTTNNIVKTIADLRQRGVEFLEIPDAYYLDFAERFQDIDEDIEDLKKMQILVDHDEKGYLLQTFTKPLGDRPTLFFEIIQRKGANSFGKGNFKALFESVEREQAKRGNLKLAS